VDSHDVEMWTRQLTFKNKKQVMETQTYKRPYLLHTDGSVITVQKNAWMDSVGIAMWCDTLLGLRGVLRDEGRIIGSL